ncbi:MAG: RedB protein, partial [Polyangiaceae bacterium]|nr:RedB protein [Polyangiaceae bacterium]
IVALWVGASAFGLTQLWRYAGTPGALEAPPARFPAESALAHEPGPTLLVFAHPHCACTRATLSELATLLARSEAAPTAYVVVADAPGLGDVGRSDAVRLARSIPGVQVVLDTGGREAALFRARTSGEVIVYDAEDRLAFHGGITASRGHVGDNEGRRRALAAVERGHAAAPMNPVFGCAIDDEKGEP